MTETASSEQKVVLLSAGRFFVRMLPVVDGSNPGVQITLALENLAPFPLGQLYYGWVPSAGGKSVLVFAAYRKRFGSDEIAGWNDAAAVVPEFLALLGKTPDVPTIRILQGVQSLAAAAWDGTNELPVAVLVREMAAPAGAEQRASLVAEIKDRCGLATATVNQLSGTVSASITDRGGVTIRVGEGSEAMATNLNSEVVAAADVRDKEFLSAQRAGQRRNLLLWRIFAGAGAGLAAMLFLEVGLLAGARWVNGLKETASLQIPAVERIEAAQALGRRIEEMTQRQLLPFEMLALINQNRPGSIQFTRTVTTGMYSIEIEAQTPQAGDVGQYEAILRAAPELATVETRDLRSRDGVTTFIIAVGFKPGSLRREGGT